MIYTSMCAINSGIATADINVHFKFSFVSIKNYKRRACKVLICAIHTVMGRKDENMMHALLLVLVTVSSTEGLIATLKLL